MVSQLSNTATSDASRDRILRAAEEEFAARGYDGAKVDRIARRARVNKAMLYYHFTNKLALYRAILVELFSGMARAVTDGRDPARPAEEELRRYIRTVAAAAATRPHFPAIWLREMAEGGRHLTPAIMKHLGLIVGALGRTLEDGRRRGRFAPVNPFVVQMGIVAPLLMFTASAPIRARFRSALPPRVGHVTRVALVEHVEATTLAAVRPARAAARAAKGSRRVR